METLELEDMQGLLAWGYGKLPYACFVLIKFGAGPDARDWLRELLPNITPASANPTEVAVNIAFTHAGLGALELDEPTLKSFPPELIEGMTTPHRQRILGDVDDNAPDHWIWGGPNTAAFHAALFIYANTPETLEAAYRNARAAFGVHGITQIKRLDTCRGSEREHFGFKDGISQPFVEGLPKRDLPTNTVPAGEFFLGYKNAYGQFPDSPSAAANSKSLRDIVLPPNKRREAQQDFGRNGSYVVFRQLEQDVAQFWRYMLTQAHGQDGAIRLAAKMVGRWPSGAPLVHAPEQDDPKLADDNNFNYAAKDADGLACPFGAHIRRANPRDAVEQTEVKLAVKIINRHRILRRGRSYGPPLVDSREPKEMLAALQANTANNNEQEEKRGLMFICLNANIQRQFEFIQHTWCNNPKFETLYDEVDAISGVAMAGADNHFTMPALPVRERVSDVPRFVQMRGGAYFFMPGIAALKYLASKTL